MKNDKREIPYHIIGAVAAAIFAALDSARFAFCAGPLWRDEAHLWTVTTRYSLSYVLRRLFLDSFPAVPHAILHLEVALGMPDADWAIRAAGLVTTLFIMAVIWIYSLKTLKTVPLVSMTALAVMPELIRTCGSCRAYGMAIFFYIISFFSIWRYLERKSASSYIAALISSLLSFHSVFSNVILTGIVLISAGLVCLIRRDYKRICAPASIAAVCFATMIVYLPMFKQRALWSDIVRIDPSYLFGLKEFAANLHGWPGCLLLICLVSIMAVSYLRSNEKSETVPQYWLFAASVVILTCVVFPAYPMLAHQDCYWWHYAGPIVACAIACDSVVLALPEAGLKIIGFSALSLLALFGVSALNDLGAKQSNVDDIAAAIQAKAKPGDRIVLMDWQGQSNFPRYYRGNAEWTTILNTHEAGLQDYAYLSKWLSSTDSMQTVLNDARKTLDTGHNLWVVGRLFRPKPGQQPPTVLTAVNGKYDWNTRRNDKNWPVQLGFEAYYLASRKKRLSFELMQPKYIIENMTPLSKRPVNPLENRPLSCVHLKARL